MTNQIRTDAGSEAPSLDLMELRLQQLCLTAPAADGSAVSALLDPTDMQMDLIRRLDNSYVEITATTPSTRIQVPL